LEQTISFADVALVLTESKGVGVLSYFTTSRTSHTISIDLDNFLILDPDKRNSDVMKFNSFDDITFYEILEKLHVLDVEVKVISHLHFVRRKKGRNNSRLKSTADKS